METHFRLHIAALAERPTRIRDGGDRIASLSTQLSATFAIAVSALQQALSEPAVFGCDSRRIDISHKAVRFSWNRSGLTGRDLEWPLDVDSSVRCAQIAVIPGLFSEQPKLEAPEPRSI
jgi:hypothetical protein